VIEVRFHGDARIEHWRGQYQQIIRDKYPLMFVPKIVPGEALALMHYRFYSENKTQFLAIALNSLAFGLNQYPGWGAFRDEFLNHWEVLHRDLQPAMLTRVGVRFTNLFRADESDDQSNALTQINFEKSYLKPLQERPVVHQGATSFQRGEYRISVQVVLPEDSQEVQVDYDAAAANVDPAQVREVTEQLHRLIEDEFFGSITSDLAESLRPT